MYRKEDKVGKHSHKKIPFWIEMVFFISKISLVLPKNAANFLEKPSTRSGFEEFFLSFKPKTKSLMKVSILGVQVVNFRTLQNANIKLAPITILTGANGAGKSSILKIFRLLQESYRKYELKQLAIEALDMGDWDSVVLDKSKPIYIMLMVKAETDQGLTSGYKGNHFIDLVQNIDIRSDEGRAKYTDQELADGYFELVGEKMIIDLEYRKEGLETFVLRHEKAMENGSFLFDFTKNREGKGNFYKTNLKNFLPALQTFEAIRNANIINEEASSWVGLPLSEEQKQSLIHKLIDELSIFNISSEEDRYNKPIDFSAFITLHNLDYQRHELNLIVDSFVKNDSEDSNRKSSLKQIRERKDWRFEDMINKDFLFWSRLLSTLIKPLIDKTFENIFDHLGALRGNQKRIYSGMHDEGTPLNDILKAYLPVQTEIERLKQEYANIHDWEKKLKEQLLQADLTEWKRKSVQDELDYKPEKIYEIDKQAVFYRFLRHYAQKMGFAQNIKVENIENYAYRVKLIQENREINLADTGFGFVQFVPLLLKLLTLYHKKTRVYYHSSVPHKNEIKTYSILEEKAIKHERTAFDDFSEKALKDKLDHMPVNVHTITEQQEDKYIQEYDNFWYDAETQKNVGIYGEFGEDRHNDGLSKILQRESEDSHEIPNSGQWFSVEEPESNLHPRLQSLLADFFMDLCKTFEVRVMIETHSEYLIRKLQELVADKKIAPKDAIIYYFRNPEIAKAEGKVQVEKIEFSENGEIPYWKFDSGFYDEHYNLELGLLNKQRGKFLETYNQLKAKAGKPDFSLEELDSILDNFAGTNRQQILPYKAQVEDFIRNQGRNINDLDEKTRTYWASALFLSANLGIQDDYSPIVMQFGRAVEHTFYELFKNFANQVIANFTDETTRKDFINSVPCLNSEKRKGLINAIKTFAEKNTEAEKMFYFKASLMIDCFEKFVSFSGIYSYFDKLDMNKLYTELDFVILNKIRWTRNEAGHTYANPISLTEATDYRTKTEQFFKTWLSALK